VDVAGIAAERAAEGSGSEWSSHSEKEENAREKKRAVVPRPEGTVGVAAGTDARVAVTRVGDDACASPLVRVFLFTDEKGLQSARPVTVRLVVASRPPPFASSGTYGEVLRASSPKSSTTPFWIGSIAERLAGLAGAWPAWDVRRSSKAKTYVETQLEDFKNATPYTPTEPRHDEGHESESDEREKEKRKESARPSNPPPPMPWSPDLSESERAARWRYAGGGMHQPVHVPATPAERWVAGENEERGKFPRRRLRDHRRGARDQRRGGARGGRRARALAARRRGGGGVGPPRAPGGGKPGGVFFFRFARRETRRGVA
jgi:hypothetical protein